MRTPIFLLGVAMLGLAGCQTYPRGPYGDPYGPSYGPGNQGSYGTALITTGNKAPLGVFLVDAGGRAVYMLEGTRGQSGMNRCSGECLNVWPPVKATGPLQAGTALDPRRLTTVPGPWGPQAAYDGWPLYYYHRDRAPGDTTGQGVHDRWGMWYLLAPNGVPIHGQHGGY